MALEEGNDGKNGGNEMKTKTEAARTPIPWKQGVNYPERIISGNRFIATTCDERDNPSPEDIANAAFIARAVNSHADLLFLLKEKVRAYEDGGIEAGGYGGQEWLAGAKKAIAKAEEQ